MRKKLRIYFKNEQSDERVTLRLRALVRRAVLATLSYERIDGPCEVSVTFTDPEGIHDLNRRFRGVDAPTDVLSFPLLEEGITPMGRMLGDIVLSLARCREQAEEFGHGFDRECAFLTVHSTLHLLGYDHETGEGDEQDMRARQTAIVAEMGLGIKEKAR